MKSEFDKEASIVINPPVNRDEDGNVLASKYVATIEVVPNGKDFHLSVDLETRSLKLSRSNELKS